MVWFGCALLRTKVYHKEHLTMKPKSLVLSHITAGFTAVLIGYTSSIVIIMQAASAAGATPLQIESWLLALGIAMGVTSIGYSWYFKTPILTAWSTPGAAMLVGIAAGYDLATLLGAFVVSGCLIFITGLISPLAKALKRIPSPLATAMLGAILLPFCVKAFTPLMDAPWLFISMFLTFMVSKRFMPKYAMLCLLLMGLGASFYLNQTMFTKTVLSIASPIWLTPHFEIAAIINIAIPLYIVTMLSQNLAGIAMMNSYQYNAPVKPILIGTGLSNMVLAPFGCFSVNLAAISAAICMNDDVDEDKNQRFKAAMWAGVFYLLAGILASSLVAMFLAFPIHVTNMLAGFALLGTLLMCLQKAFLEDDYREPALLTFLITLSGVSFLGVNSIVWGLLIGWLYARLMKLGYTK
ncbi:benzoate/H(+) symporter BenE family transporter [Pseudoalteromonas sp. SSM20]|uniref:benzoate/H(+) symporter BenE family transporter n=1 Tax=Pseudoalteromonas sp. SSM20 TaxID=3139394 RepID=UPI003BA99BDD